MIAMAECKILILAAGEGTRMKSDIPKVLHTILGKPMLLYVIDMAKAAGACEVAVVVGKNAARIAEVTDIPSYLQTEQLGTGHAVLSAADFLRGDENDHVVVLCGDTPLLTAQTIRELVEQHEREGNDATVMTAVLDNPTGYGRILRDSVGRFLRNVEQRDASEEEKNIREVNTGVYCFRAGALLASLSQIQNHNAQREYYLTDVPGILRTNGRPVGVKQAEDFSEFLGVNTKVQLAEAALVMQKRINAAHMLDGVIIPDPAAAYIGPDAVIGVDTVIWPGCLIEGRTTIGAHCEIGPQTRLTDMLVGDRVVMQNSVALEASVGDDSVVGPFAYIRPHSEIGQRVKVGDFVEVKNAKIGDGTKASHLTYIGDADVGENVNFGCGTVTVNYDGRSKARTTIEDGAFVGCNTNLIAPVTVGANAYIAAGSTVTEDVPSGNLGIARARQVNKAEWKDKRKS